MQILGPTVILFLQSQIKGRHMERITYSIKEACALLGVSRSWLYSRWKLKKGPPKIVNGRRALIPAQGLNAWIAESEVRHGP